MDQEEQNKHTWPTYRDDRLETCNVTLSTTDNNKKTLPYTTVNRNSNCSNY